MSHFITGVVVEICTPFDEKGEIDWQYLREMVRWHVSCGVSAFFVNGYAGECHELTFDEKLAVLKAVYEEVHDDAKIMHAHLRMTSVQTSA